MQNVLRGFDLIWCKDSPDMADKEEDADSSRDNGDQQDTSGATSSPTEVREGQAVIQFPSPQEVFYNPVQEFNRDISIAVIKLYVKKELLNNPNFKESGIQLLEALSASGLRSIRYAKEIDGLDKIVANDISVKAVESIKRNVEANGVGHVVEASHNDASLAMYLRRRPRDRFAIIDLDPYGSPTPFLDAALQSVADGGLLCVTATDLAILCGNAPETCHAKYGAVCLRSKCCHEMALRIILQCLESHANRYGRYVTPLVSLSVDFYVRIFVRVRSSQRECKRSAARVGHAYQCSGCESITASRLGRVESEEGATNVRFKLGTGPPVGRTCEHCGRPFHVGGPFWLDPIHDRQFVSDLVDSLEEAHFGTYERMRGMLSVVGEELPDVPFYYTQDRLCNHVRTASGKHVTLRSALLNAGHRVSLSHANKHAIKTDAPNDFVWDVMRAWERQNPVNRDKLPRDGVAWTILEERKKSDPPPVDFTLHPKANPESRQVKLKRFQVNPERNWGPKPRAMQGTFDDNAKRERNQGKKRKRQDRSEVGEDGEKRLQDDN